MTATILKKSSLLLSDQRLNHKIYDNDNHFIYFMVDNEHNELIFLYDNLIGFNYIDPLIKVVSDSDYFCYYNEINEEINEYGISSSSPEHLEIKSNYNMLGYPIMLNRRISNLYSFTFGTFKTINTTNDINNNYGKKIKANSIFLKNSLIYLKNKYPDIEIFDEIAEFSENINPFNIIDVVTDFNRRVAFFKKNGFTIINKSNIHILQKSSNYEHMWEMIAKNPSASFVYYS